MSNTFMSAGSAKSTGGSTFVTNMSLDRSYVYSVLGATPAATPTDIVTLSGSATRLVRVRKIVLSGFATAAGTLAISLLRRSTAHSGGTSTTPAITQLDTRDPAPTAVARLFTANPTVGTLVSPFQSFRLNMGVAAAVGAPITLDLLETEGFVLNGTSEFLAINGNGGTVPTAGVLDIAIYWTEE